MRELVMVACVLAAGCAGRGGNADSTVARDSAIVGGPRAVPSSLTPAETTQRASTPASTGSQSSPGSAATEVKVASPAPAPGPDSVRGIVSVVGTSFDKRVMVAPHGGGRRVEITGKLATLVGHVAGTDVTVTGTRSGTQLEAASFVVRMVDGQPAIDGVLRTESEGLYIVSANGVRTRIVAPPPPLQGKEGARVWITGDPAKAVASFGFIDPPR